MAVNHRRQCSPTVATGPNEAHIPEAICFGVNDFGSCAYRAAVSHCTLAIGRTLALACLSLQEYGK